MASITPISATDFSTYDGGNYQAMRGIASSTDGQIIYVCMNGVTGIGVMKSANTGATWSNVYPSTTSFTSIACSADGSIVYAAWLGGGLYKSINAGVNWNQVTFSPDVLPGGAANPESPAGGQFPGYQLSNNYQIACDSTGTKLIMTTNAAASIYGSINGGVTWSFLYVPPGYVLNPNAPTMVASNADGTILYAALNTNSISKTIIVSKNSGSTWASINTFGIFGPFPTLSTNSFGDFVFAVGSTSNLNIFYPTHADKAVLVPSAGNTLVALANYNDGNNAIISQNTYQTIVNGAVVLYSIVNKYSPGSIPCFKEDTKILTEQGYKLIQELRQGDLIKTLKHGFVPINMIGKREIKHLASSIRIKDQLYRCSKDKYPEIMENGDLILTGCHSILVDNFKDETERERTIEINGDTYVTDRKYRLPACADERAAVYEIPGTYMIYHIALDHDDYYMNYGIYANGLLVETCSIRYLKEESNMTLIE